MKITLLPPKNEKKEQFLNFQFLLKNYADFNFIHFSDGI